MDAIDSGAGAAESTRRERFAQVYGQLQSLARRELGSSPRTSLDTSALVHEAWLKLDGATLPGGRGEFLTLAARAMRYVLVDHIRARMAEKRGGAQERIPLATDIAQTQDSRFDDLLAVDRGLLALEKLDPRLVSVVECRFFGGMEFGEIAEHLAISERTAQRDWRRARAFLQSYLGDASA